MADHVVELRFTDDEWHALLLMARAEQLRPAALLTDIARDGLNLYRRRLGRLDFQELQRR